MSSASAAKPFQEFSRNQLFAGIQSEILEEIESDVGLVRLDKGEVIFREGDPGDSLYLVGRGSVKISKTGRSGKQETLGFVRSGSFFGEMALLDPQPRSAMATAVEPTVLGSVNESAFQHILQLAPSRLHMNFLRGVSERLRSINSHFITEVMRTERLSLVGAMASTIIQDLKNPICIARCCSELIASESADPRLHELTSMLDGAVGGMLATMQELLDYARGSTALVKERITIWRLLHELDDPVFRLLPGENIRLTKHIRYEGEIEVDVARFTRLLCNLIKNSREAMPDGGILTITIDLVADEVVLRISDTGTGIPPEVLPKLFEPFVTHGKSRGTGLGLAMAKSIVTAHGGRISAASVQDKGTTIDIRLPVPANK